MGGWLWGGRGVARGLVTMVGAERVTLHTFDVMSVEIVGAKLTVKAETALARMRRWVSEYTLTWTGTLRNLLERLAAWCDIHAVSVDGAAAWSNTISGFVVASGQRGDQVLARLQRYYPFVVEMNGGTLTGGGGGGGAGGAAAFRRGAGGCGNSGWGELADCRDRGEVSEAARDGADADAAGDDVKRKA